MLPSPLPPSPGPQLQWPPSVPQTPWLWNHCASANTLLPGPGCCYHTHAAAECQLEKPPLPQRQSSLPVTAPFCHSLSSQLTLPKNVPRWEGSSPQWTLKAEVDTGPGHQHCGGVMLWWYRRLMNGHRVYVVGWTGNRSDALSQRVRAGQRFHRTAQNKMQRKAGGWLCSELSLRHLQTTFQQVTETTDNGTTENSGGHCDVTLRTTFG